MYIRFFYTKLTNIALDKLLDILYKAADFVLKGGTTNYAVINKQTRSVSWSSNKRENHFVFTKSFLKEAINLFYITAFCLLENHDDSSNWNTNGI